MGKELLRAGTAAARAALDRLGRWSDGVAAAELSRLARTVRAWEAEILAWHRTGGCSNEPTQAVNLANHRLRLLLHCGVRWHTHHTARLREHSPRLMA